MPLYIADYLSATEHLDAAHSGAYLHLIMHYWQKAKLPHEDKFLARIARMTDRQWAVAKPTLKAFFSDDWRHERIDSELAHAQLKAEARATSGSRGGYAKSLKNKIPPVAKASDLPQQTPSKTPSEPLPSSSESTIEELASASSKPSAQKPTPRSILLECLSPETADGVIAHRKAKRAPLTSLAARELVKGFNSTGDPNAAATMMVARGWQGFKAEWFENDRSERRNGKASVQDASRDLAERAAVGLVDFGPLPPAYMPDRHRDAPRVDPPRLLPEGGRGEPGDLRGGGGVGLVILPGSGRLPGDGPTDRVSRDIEMASDSLGGSFRLRG